MKMCLTFNGAASGRDGIRNCWAVLAAFSIWLGFPNDLASWAPAALLWPTGLMGIGIASGSLKSALFFGWLASACGMEASLYWLCMPIAQVGGLPWPFAILVSLFIPALLATQGAIFCGFALLIRTRSFLQQSILAALAWYLLELGFAWLIGFPWLPICAALVQWPELIQLAGICGSYFLGAVWLLAALWIAAPLLGGGRFGWRLSGFGICLILLIVYFGKFSLENPGTGESVENMVYALIVEGNIDQNQKWTLPFQKKSLETYITLTDEGLAGARKDGVNEPLILWPETAMPFFYETISPLKRELDEAARRWGCPILFGAPGIRQSGNIDEVYNRAFLLGPSAQLLGYYDKVHLVPFGEYLPEWLRVDFLKALLQGVGIYYGGTSTESLIYGNLALGILICYEAIFPWLARDRVEAGASILIDISNDGWFGRTPASRQHLYLTALRCVEQNRWLWRATNTGISAVIDNRSRIVEAGPQFQAGSMLWGARLETERSIFYYLGNWLPWAACAIFGVLFISGERCCPGNKR